LDRESRVTIDAAAAHSPIEEEAQYLNKVIGETALALCVRLIPKGVQERSGFPRQASDQVT
jgi:hypothetical protein